MGVCRYELFQLAPVPWSASIFNSDKVQSHGGVEVLIAELPSGIQNTWGKWPIELSKCIREILNGGAGEWMAKLVTYGDFDSESMVFPF